MTLDIKTGIDWIIEGLEAAEHPHKLVAIYGLPDAGKSYLMECIKRECESRGHETACFSGAVGANFFRDINESPERVKPVVLFHYGDRRPQVDADDDPAFLSRTILCRPIDLTVGIYNPNFQHPLRGEYDVLIANPASKKKPAPF